MNSLKIETKDETKDESEIDLTCSKVLQEMLTIDLWHDMIESSNLLYGSKSDYPIFMSLAKNFWNDDNHGKVFIYKNDDDGIAKKFKGLDKVINDENAKTQPEPVTFIHRMHEKVYDYQCRKGNIFYGIELNYKTDSVNVDESDIPQRQHYIKPVFELFEKDIQIYYNLQNNLSTKAALELNKPYNCGLNIYVIINQL